MDISINKRLVACIGTLMLVFIFMPFFLVFLPYHIIFPAGIADPVFDLGIMTYGGLIFIGFGFVSCLWCVWNFVFDAIGTPLPLTPTQNLITNGLYRFVRNPMYVAVLCILAGEALLFQSLGMIIYTLVLFGIFNMNVLYEETYLAQRFGTAYKKYRQHVPRWVPRLTPYKG